MNIGVLGARVIGSTLGTKWVKAGHAVMFGVRHPSTPDVQSLVRELGRNARAGSVEEAIRFGEVILFAIPGAAMEETIRMHAPLLQGKIVIDAANRTGEGSMNSVEDFAKHDAGAFVFRAFNSLGWENFENPAFGYTRADLFYCGPGGKAQMAVEKLIEDVGLRPIRLGEIDQVHLVDAVTRIWFALVYGQKKGRHLAFKVLTR